MFYGLGRWFFKWSFKILFGLKCYGSEHLPRGEAFIVASNHQSYLDPPAVGACAPMKFNFMAKRNLFSNRFTTWVMSNVRCIPVKRDSRDVGAIKTVLNKLKRGEPLAIFPEGTRSQDGRLQSGELGVGYLALKSGVSVVPAYVNGTADILPRGSKFPRRGKITVFFGDRIDFKPLGKTDKEAVRLATERVMEAIRRLRDLAYES